MIYEQNMLEYAAFMHGMTYARREIRYRDSIKIRGYIAGTRYICMHVMLNILFEQKKTTTTKNGVSYYVPGII